MQIFYSKQKNWLKDSFRLRLLFTKNQAILIYPVEPCDPVLPADSGPLSHLSSGMDGLAETLAPASKSPSTVTAHVPTDPSTLDV